MKHESSRAVRKQYSVVDQGKVAVLDSAADADGRTTRYELAQCKADLFNRFTEPQRTFVVVRDGRPVKRRDGRMRRFYARLKALDV